MKISELGNRDVFRLIDDCDGMQSASTEMYVVLCQEEGKFLIQDNRGLSRSVVDQEVSFSCPMDHAKMASETMNYCSRCGVKLA